MTPKKRALISVSDKSGLVPFVRRIAATGCEIVSTGGTAKVLLEAGIPVTPIESVTGNPEAFGGRMKTLSFQIESGLLFRGDHPQDLAEAEKLGIRRIDLLVCNLYPFDEVVRKGSEYVDWIENIDIGGPTMIRAGAKNHQSVTVVTDPADYEVLAEEWESAGGVSIETRERLALKAFELTAGYDLRVASSLLSKRGRNLRYGENPHQSAILLRLKNSSDESTLAAAKILQGKEVSYNNWLDSDQAFKLASELSHLQTHPPGGGSAWAHCVIVKHGTPCGVGGHADLATALELAIEGDPVSAFGGIVAFDQALEGASGEAAAKRLAEMFIEVVIAPGFSPAVQALFRSKKNLRVLETPMKKKQSGEWAVRSIHGGLLVQDEDERISQEIKQVTRAVLPDVHRELSPFALTVTKFLKSNCIGVFGKRRGGHTCLVSGVGQPNRLECITRLIAGRVHDRGLDITDGLLVSDAFFPFKDSIEAIRELGVRSVLQPGGSIRDAEVIAAADEAGIAMGFTGMRNFRH
jgi:phosphoribosylaminoimidazolecarboxamide formyltransferase/IMP cyclohydrolase